MSELANDTVEPTLDIPNAIQIDTGVTVQLHFHGDDARHHGTVVGMDPDRFLIVKLHDSTMLDLSKLFQGNSVIVRYLHNGVVHGFESQSRGHITSPDRLLFVSYPVIVATQELRRQKRTACLLPATMRHADNEAVGRLCDLSVAGALFNIALPDADASFPENQTEFELEFLLPGSAEPLATQATVRNQNRQDRPGYSLGVEFNEKHDAEDSVVRTFLAKVGD